MERIIDNTNCLLYGTEYCDLLNWSACKTCPIGRQKDKESQEETIKTFDTLMHLVPEEGVAPLFVEETCQFCRGEPKRKRSGYMMTLIGNKEPKTMIRNILLMKTQSQAGSMITLYISCCPRCHRNHVVVRNVPLITAVLLTIIGFVGIFLTTYPRAATPADTLLPQVILAVIAVGGYLIGIVLQKYLKKVLSGQTVFDPWEIPLATKLGSLGWFPLEGRSSAQQLIFTKNRAMQGVYTGEGSKGKAKV